MKTTTRTVPMMALITLLPRDCGGLLSTDVDELLPPSLHQQYVPASSVRMGVLTCDAFWDLIRVSERSGWCGRVGVVGANLVQVDVQAQEQRPLQIGEIVANVPLLLRDLAHRILQGNGLEIARRTD